MTKHEYLILSIILVLFLCFAVYQWGNMAGEVELCEAYNEGHAEGYRKAYCDGVDKYMDKLSEVIARYENKETPQEKLPLLNKILKLKGD